MLTRATTTKRRVRSTSSAVIAATLALAGCGPRTPQQSQSAAVRLPGHGASADCLAKIWQSQIEPDTAYDRAHDRADGGAISCATGTTASQFAAVLMAIREATGKGDRSALIAEVGLPLLFIDSEGHKSELDREAVTAHADEVFSAPVLRLLTGLQVEDLAVVPQQGAFADLGAVWLLTGRTGGRPRIVTIDHQALDEAASAKRRR
jgi:hypothetical protein